nr:MAG TPA: hypothetical protein [Caudoviricetes sp.]
MVLRASFTTASHSKAHPRVGLIMDIRLSG